MKHFPTFSKHLALHLVISLLPLFFTTQGPFSFRVIDLVPVLSVLFLFKKSGFNNSLKYFNFYAMITYGPLLVLDYFFWEVANITALVIGLLLPLLISCFNFLKFSFVLFRTKSFLKSLLFCSFSWVGMALAFPPLPLGYFSWILLIPWLNELSKVDKKQGAALSYWSGVLFHGIMLYWITNVVKVGPAVAVSAGLFLLISFLSLFHVLGG